MAKNSKKYDELLEKYEALRREFEMLNSSGPPNNPVTDDTNLPKSPDESYQAFSSDISEHKLAAEKLKQISEKWEAIISASPDGIGMVSLDGKIQFVSDKLAELYGYTIENKGEIVGMSLFDFIDPSDALRLNTNLHKVLSGEKIPKIAEYRAFKKDGSRFDFEVNYNILYDAEGTPVSILFVERDITERKQIEAELKESELKYRSLIEYSSDVVFCVDAKGEYQFANKSFASAFGKSPEEFIGLTYWDIYSKEQADFRQSITSQVFKTGETQRSDIEVPFPDKTLYFIAHANPIVDENGNVILCLVNSTNITDRKNAELALKESELKYRELVEHSPDAIAIHINGKIVFVNNECVRLMRGASADDLIGKTVLDFVHPDYRQFVFERMKKAATEGIVLPLVEEKFIRFDGTPVDVEVKAVPLTMDGKPAVQLIVRDVTERKCAEETLRDSQYFLSELIENSGALIFVKDIHGRYELVNNRWEELTGINREKALGKTDKDLFPGKIGEEFRKNDLRVIEQGSAFEIEEMLEDSNGNKYFLAIKFPIRDKNNIIRGVCGITTEITERKNAEEKLRVSEAHFRLLTEDVSDIVWKQDANNIFTYISPADEHLRGYTADEVIGHHPFEFFSEESIASVAEMAKKLETAAMRGENIESAGFEVRQRCKDGRWIWTEIISKVEHDEYGKVTGFHGISRDITKRKEMEQELKLSEITYRGIINEVSELIYVQDEEGRFLDVNAQAEKIYGYSREYFIGKTPEFLSAPGKNDFEKVIKAIENAFNGVPQNFEFWGITKDGRVFPKEVSVSLGTYYGKKAIIAVARDVTERKAVEAELEENREKYRALSEATFESIFLSEKGICIEQNLTAEKMFGYTSEEALGRYGTDWIVPEDRDMVMNNMLKGYEDPYEATALRKDGTTFPCMLRGKMMYFKGRKVRVTSLSDISEQKQAELALKESEEKYRTIIQYSNDPIYSISSDYKYRFVNEAFGKRVGLQPHEIIGKTLYDIYSVDEAKKRMSVLKKVFETGEREEYEVSTVIVSGELRYYLSKIDPVKDVDGLVHWVSGISVDITERRTVEETLKESQANLAAIIENTTDNIWAIDTEYTIVYINEVFRAEFETNFGKSLQIGDNVLDCIPEELRSFWAERYARALSNERFQVEDVINTGTKTFYLETFFNPIVADGTVIGASIFSRDISDRKKAESILSESKANLAAIIENTTNSIWAINTNYEIIYINEVFRKAFLASFGVDLQIGMNMPDAVPEPIRPLWKSRYDRALANEQFTFVDKIDLGNTFLYIEVSMNPIVVDGKVIGGSFFSSDITERKIAEDKIKNAHDELKKINSEKDKFFSIIAHDLRSPFHGLLNLSEMMAYDSESFSITKFVKISKLLNDSSKNLYQLLSNLLEWAQVQRGVIDFELKENQLYEIVTQSIEPITQTALEKEITIVNKVSEDLMVVVDGRMINTVVRNLISNAVKFTKKNGVITIKAEKSEGDITTVSVADTGVGMSKEEIDKLFKIGEKVNSKGTAGETGTGLGLILCKEFVEKHGGIIWVESEEDLGSTFSFTIPVNIR